MRYSEIDNAAQAARQCIADMEMTPQEINDGWCEAFAIRLRKKLGDRAALVSTTQMKGVFPGHVVVRYDGKYYDAESPEGVVNPQDLAYSRRLYAVMQREN
jgi:hypothetical protein